MAADKKKKKTAEMAKKGSYHHGDLARALVHAAVDLIQTGGIEALTLRGAARKAGVSVAAPYRHFESKQDLLVAVAVEGFHQFSRLLKEAVDQTEGDAFDGLTSIGKRYIAFAVENPGFIAVMFGSELSPEEYPELAQAGDEAYAHLLQTVAACHEQMGSDENIEVTAIMAWSMVHGYSQLLSSNKLRQRGPEGIERLTEAILINFEQGLRALAGS